jgi:transposase-like protein
MDASEQFCPNEACTARGQIGAGNISIHGRKRPRYKYHHCGKTFSARKGTMLEGLRTDEEKVAMVVTLLSYGCPLQAIVHAFGLDERTVAAWQKRAGKQCQRVHTAVVEQGKVKSQHIQADAHTSKREEAHYLDSFSDGCDNTLMAGRRGQSASGSHAH